MGQSQRQKKSAAEIKNLKRRSILCASQKGACALQKYCRRNDHRSFEV
jgi:hypothetical protein